ncbi:GNAT family N-acetyltransferase [Rhizobium sp. Leaf341]|uniref:GNAT family N-acetyltransferase n=1 Tax=Rhizobium sp. Leaf341 TaxID=1736344 RepID=UPI0009E92219|nr:GNAT family N-acetyltransferase [Rhizobium sp. Leaf341]
MQLAHFTCARTLAAQVDSERVRDLISNFAVYYPGIDRWFTSKVQPGLMSGARKILVDVADNNKLNAIAILKKNDSEKKICTFWVSPTARGRGVGRRLLADSVAWLECATPLLTVPEEELANFKPLLSETGFKLTQFIPGAYRHGSIEYVFNGSIPTRGNSIFQ